MLDDKGEEMDKAQPTYRSYLLRLWRTDNAGQPVCRASLELPGSHRQIYFDSLSALCGYLATQVGLTNFKKPAGDHPEQDKG
jgi:hypothetical protein